MGPKISLQAAVKNVAVKEAQLHKLVHQNIVSCDVLDNSGLYPLAFSPSADNNRALGTSNKILEASLAFRVDDIPQFRLFIKRTFRVGPKCIVCFSEGINQRILLAARHEFVIRCDANLILTIYNQ